MFRVQMITLEDLQIISISISYIKTKEKNGKYSSIKIGKMSSPSSLHSAIHCNWFEFVV